MNHRNVRRAVVASLGLFVSHAALCDAADIPIPGRTHMIRAEVFQKMVAKPITGTAFVLPLPGSDGDPISNGGSLEIRDSTGGSVVTFGLSGSNKWRGLGNPPGSKGYKYRGAGSGSEPCKVVLLRGSVIKFVCFGAGPDPMLPFGGTSQITLRTGTDSYCAEFGGTETKNDDVLLKRKDAPAPPSCQFITCCGGKRGVKLTTTNAPGDCGDLVDQFGGLYGNVSCGGLYIGGGGNTVSLPAKVPDATEIVTKFVGCTGGNTATLGAATAAETGSNRNCTEPGCLFGAPQPIPNSMNIPSSVCVVSRIATAATGTLNCLNSVTNVDLGITAETFLTGDTATDPGSTIAGIQPCPLCSGSTCIGGANNGMSCAPGTGNLGNEFPTSQDCPPAANLSVGTLPVAFAFRTGTVTWTAVPSAAQPRVFAGYCHDADTTLAFQGPPAVKCLENGMAVANCTQPFEACHQRGFGAFGPNAGSVMTITVIGSSGGDLTAGPQPTKLVSVFAIPPTYNNSVDAAADLPGPGAIAIPGIAALCPTLSTCP
jgi:hypothetical protein